MAAEGEQSSERAAGSGETQRGDTETRGAQRSPPSVPVSPLLPLPAPCSPLPTPLPANPMAEVRDECGISQKYLSIFIDESETALDDLTAALLAREGGGDDLKGLMGIAHKIKGSAASIGLNRIAKLAHLMEDLLQELLQKHSSLSSGLTSIF